MEVTHFQQQNGAILEFFNFTDNPEKQLFWPALFNFTNNGPYIKYNFLSYGRVVIYIPNIQIWTFTSSYTTKSKIITLSSIPSHGR